MGENVFVRSLSNLIVSLVNMSPSRNYIVQFLYLIEKNQPVDYRVLEEGYPEIVRDEYVRGTLAGVFGISFGKSVRLEPNGFGKTLVDFVDRIFKLFEDEEFRAKVGAILKEEFPRGIPNLAKEWVEARLKGLASEPSVGKPALGILREIARLGEAKFEDLEKSMNVTRGTIMQSLTLLELYGLVTEDYDGKYRLADDLRKYKDLLEVAQE